MKIIFIVLICFFSFNTFALSDSDLKLYNKLELNGKISKNVFDKALKKHKNSNEKKINKDIISIIDFSKKSTIKRLAVIHLRNETVLFNEYVTHGKKSGHTFSNSFSNIKNSHQSSIGQYLTENTYYGKHGYSLKLEGKENTNSLAKERYIVFHGAKYATQSFIDKYGYLGRSHGCPAVDNKVSKAIIDTIKNGTYIYAYN